jgi:hypothetical protein
VFYSKLREETDLGRLVGEPVSVERETMRPEHGSLWSSPPVKKDPTKAR